MLGLGLAFLGGQARWTRRQSRWLAGGPEAVAGRPVARPLSLGALKRAEPPGAFRGGTAAELGHRLEGGRGG